MSKMSRDKGAAGERELAAILRKAGIPAERELDQYQGPLGRDLKGTQPYCIQVKRVKHATWGLLDRAFAEAESALDIAAGYHTALVAFREDFHPWMVALRIMFPDGDSALMVCRLRDILPHMAKSRKSGAHDE